MKGLSIDACEFEKLPQKQQLKVLYDNTEELKIMVRGYKLNQKIQYFWLVILTLAIGLGKYLSVF